MLAGAIYHALSTKEFYNINQDSFNIMPLIGPIGIDTHSNPELHEISSEPLFPPSLPTHSIGFTRTN